MQRRIALRRWRNWALILMVFAVGMPVSAAVAIRSSEAHRRLRQLAIEAIHNELGLEARLGRVQVELIPFGIVARDVALDDVVYGRLADAEQIRIRPSLGAFLRGRVDLNAIELTGAHVHLVIRDGELRNLPRIDTGGDGGEVTLPFHRLVIRDAALSIDAEVSIEIHVSELSIRGEPSHIVDATLAADGGFVQHGDIRDMIDRVDAHVRIHRTAVSIPSLDLRVGPLTALLRDGQLPLPLVDPREKGANYRGHVEVAYDLAHLMSFRDLVNLPRLSGNVQLRADLQSDPSKTPVAVGTLTLARAQIDQYCIGEHATLEFEADTDSVRIVSGDIRALSDGGSVHLTGSVGLNDAFPIATQLEVQGLSFAALMEQFGVTPNSIVEWLFDGTMVLVGSLRDLSLSGPIDLHTHDFLVNNGSYRDRPLRPVIQIPRGHFRGMWSIGDNAVRFNDLVAELPHSRLFANVHLGFDNELRVSARAEPANLADIGSLAGMPISGTGSASVRLDGTFQSVEVTGHASVRDFAFVGMRFGDVETDAVLDRDGMAVTFPHPRAVKGRSRYAIRDLYLNFRDSRFRMGGLLQTERLAMSDFYHLLGVEDDERFEPYQGEARGEVDIDYTNGYPGDSPTGTLELGLRLGFPRAELSGFEFDRGILEGRFRWDDWAVGATTAVLDVERGELHKGAGSVVFSGSMHQGGVLEMTGVADAIPLTEIEGVGDRLPGIGGIASATAMVRGTIEAMRVNIDLGVTNVVWLGRPIGDGRAYVKMTDQADPWIREAASWGAEESERQPCGASRAALANADWSPDPPLRTVMGLLPQTGPSQAFVVCGNGLGGRMNLDLAVGRTSQLPLRGILALDGLDLTPYLPASTRLDGPRSSGRISATARFEGGGISSPTELDMRLDVAELQLGRGDLVLSNDGPLSLLLHDGVARVGRARLVGPNSSIRAEGTYAFPRADRPGGLAIEVRSKLDLALATRLSPAIESASGRVKAELALSGPLFDPELFGAARVDRGSLRVAGIATPVEDLDARIRFSARTIAIDELSGRFSGGRVRGRGTASIGGGTLERYSVEVRADNVSMNPAEGLEVALSSDIEIGWTRGQRLPLARGEVRVERLAYTAPINLGATLGDISRAQRAVVQRYDPAADRVQLDLRINEERPFVIRNNLVDAEISIDSQRAFQIVGTDQRYGILGGLRFGRGQVFFRNTTFDLLSGSVAFDDPTQIDPRFSVQASTVFRRSGELGAPRWRILLGATGSMSAFRITTSSDPELPQEDLLMLLAIGMTRNELETLQAGELGTTAALEALSAVTGVDREVRRALPIIDDFRISSAYSPRSGRTEPRVSIGRRITDQVRLSATTSLGASSDRDVRATVNVQIDDTTGLQCSYDNYSATSSAVGNIGCDLIWRLEF